MLTRLTKEDAAILDRIDASVEMALMLDDCRDYRVMLARIAQVKLSKDSPYKQRPEGFLEWEESCGPWHEYFESRPELIQLARS